MSTDLISGTGAANDYMHDRHDMHDSCLCGYIRGAPLNDINEGCRVS